jgi:preprotein translocase subunit SecD
MSNRRSYLILVGLILAALAGAALLAIPGSPAHKKVTLGLDLQGGLEVVLKAVPPKGKTCDSACRPLGLDHAQPDDARRLRARDPQAGQDRS